MVFLQWTLFYAVPAAIAVYIKNKQSSLKNRVLIIHAGILVSIALLSIIGVRLSLQPSLLSFAVIAAGVSLSLYLLGKHGAAYALSSVIQEWCILLAASYLAGGYGIIIGIIATSLVFAFAHRIGGKDPLWKLPIIFLWGCASITLYVWLGEPLINIGLHTALGAILIYKGFLFTNRGRDVVL